MNEKAKAVSTVYARLLADYSFGNILEIGSSGGANLLAITAKQRYAVDIDAQRIEEARDAGIHAEIVDIEIDDIPFGRDFDLVICCDVLEHLHNPVTCLEKAKAVLAPSGLALFHVPNEFRLTNLMNLILGRSFISAHWFPGTSEWDYPHVRFFSAQGFRQLLGRVGFEVVEDFTLSRAGRMGRIIAHQLFLPGPTLLCRKKTRPFDS